MKQFKLLKVSIAATVLLFAAKANAQLDSNNVFLSGNYAQAAISPNGAFGSTCHQPAGYYGNCYGHLGFIADPDMDGFATGTPAFYGDFFYPGSPFEGWSIQVDGSRADGFGTAAGAFTTGLTGSNISYATVGSSRVGVWQGTFNGLTIKQVTTLDTNSLYFGLQITITNLDTIPHNNIYYMRTLDPDNDEMEPGGTFVTNNTIVYNRPTDSFSLVSAVGQTFSTAYLGLGSNDTNTRSFIYAAWPMTSTVDLATVYNETYAATYSGVYNGDVAVGLIFNVGHLAPVDSAADSVYRTTSGLHPANSKTFNYFYSFSPAASTAALHAGTHTSTLGINNVNNTDIQIYPNPAKNTVNVIGLSTTDKIQVIDMMGRVIANYYNTSNNSININNLTAGAYMFVVYDENGNVKTRLPLQKN